MARRTKIERIKTLEAVLKTTKDSGNWTTYNEAAEGIGCLNRSLRAARRKK